MSVASKFEPIQSFEPLTKLQFGVIKMTVRPIEAMVVGLGDTDISKGAGVIDGQTKCVWRKDRKRITLSHKSDVFIMSVSNDPDPSCPE